MLGGEAADRLVIGKHAGEFEFRQIGVQIHHRHPGLGDDFAGDEMIGVGKQGDDAVEAQRFRHQVHRVGEAVVEDPVVLVRVLGDADIDLMHIPFQRQQHLRAFSGFQFAWFHRLGSLAAAGRNPAIREMRTWPIKPTLWTVASTAFPMAQNRIRLARIMCAFEVVEPRPQQI